MTKPVAILELRTHFVAVKDYLKLDPFRARIHQVIEVGEIAPFIGKSWFGYGASMQDALDSLIESEVPCEAFVTSSGHK